jgi:hypothetical protein
MRLIKRSIDQFATTIPGLSASIQRTMDSIRPYVTIMLQGIHYKQEFRDDLVRENDRLMTHYSKWVPMLVGKEAMPFIRGSSKKCMLGSSAQKARYFHDLLDYPIIARTPAGAPALGKKQIFKMRLKHDNPLLDLCVAYTEIQKETGMLKFNPWIGAGDMANPSSTQKPLSFNWPRVCQNSDQRLGI